MKVNRMRVLSRRGLYRTYILSILLVVLMVSAVVYDYEKNASKAAVLEGISDSLIRFHVIANSDTDEDQRLKLQVRDAVLDKMTGILSESKNIEETRQLIYDHMDSMKDIASGIITDYGYAYSVNISLKLEQFPLKAYGDIILPPGKYEALLIEIGEAKGKNWWCVMFPPLCFVDVTRGVVPEATKETLKNVLTDEEYKTVVIADAKEDVPVKVKFKFLEWLNFNKKKQQEPDSNKVFVQLDESKK
ncbi:stage II sporulation protein R [Vallitalea pronyensis]|uniref:Stage II sporulation protein R n=1 Tax=Vallitalea pronyensis TaxID=1348613 RepID=A0A8J8MGY8_9FIRM|nr:stage II sporulation protein R [Vallitalea pronyensis]QUI21399.1 stage II sporulation protein R [Vallitalea pronyensis]